MTKPKKDLTQLARKMMNGVVQIHVEGNIEEDIQSVMDPSIKIPSSWSGSGFFIKYGDLEGYIVTNAHVVRNAEKVEITSMLTSEERFDAEVVGLVKQLEPDVALLKLSKGELSKFKKVAVKNIEYLELHEGPTPPRGEEIKAIGYPLGMVEPNISGGEITNFVSGSEFTTERFVTNAAINPGNSGGPSIGRDGKVIGLNTAVIAGAENIGFITPSNFVKIIIDNLLKENEPQFAGLAAKLQKNSECFNLLLKQDSPKGILVAKVMPKGLLDQAGIKQRDVILALNGVEFDRHGIVIGKEGHFRHKNVFDIIKLIPIGCDVEIKYLRAGQVGTTTTKATANPVKGVHSRPVIEDRKYFEIFGMVVQELSFEIIEAMRGIDINAQIDMIKTIDRENPVLVVTHIHQGTQADDMEWPIGEMIAKVNQIEVHALDDLKKVIQDSTSEYLLMECESGRIGHFKNNR